MEESGRKRWWMSENIVDHPVFTQFSYPFDLNTLRGLILQLYHCPDYSLYMKNLDILSRFLSRFSLYLLSL